ncbi:MAG TPA: ABC transporter ATP-binding protein [Actinomycetota bacterium]|jgi:branched-chain amino acid transport system ATP-binding protein|nr:ABC transporter ATP-binding protein [Actinomycetota bacterium]
MNDAKTDGQSILSLKDVSASYGPVRVLEGVNIDVQSGEIVCMLGSNAAGKTTTLRTILGMIKPSQGEITLDGERIDGLNTTEVVAKRITMVPENRRLFAKMTVRENMEIGANLRDDDEGIKEDQARMVKLFPRLKERLNQKAGTLSGGEQQMLAISRALMAKPKVLLMDEPSMGLAPILVEQVFETIKEINEQGTTIFLVEQNANMALSVAHRGYAIQTGRIVLSDTAQALRDNPLMQEAYLGVME